jgi:hypothetical protein
MAAATFEGSPVELKLVGAADGSGSGWGGTGGGGGETGSTGSGITTLRRTLGLFVKASPKRTILTFEAQEAAIRSRVDRVVGLPCTS